MNGEVKRPQRGGDLPGAQGPHRVPPAKAVGKSRQFSGRFSRKDVNVNLFSHHLPSVVQYIVHSLALVPAVISSVCAVLISRGRRGPLSLALRSLARDASLPLSSPRRCLAGECLAPLRGLVFKTAGRQRPVANRSVARTRTNTHQYAPNTHQRAPRNRTRARVRLSATRRPP